MGPEEVLEPPVGVERVALHVEEDVTVVRPGQAAEALSRGRGDDLALVLALCGLLW